MTDDGRPTALAMPNHGNLRMAYARPVTMPRSRSRHLRLVRSAKLPKLTQAGPFTDRRPELRLVSSRGARIETSSSYAALVLSTVRRWLGAR